MSSRAPLVGRQEELDRVQRALERAREGHGSLLLVSGEAGVGKSRLAREATLDEDVLRGAAVEGVTAPYGPIVDALRSRLRTDPQGLSECGPLRSHLALLLPELGDPAPESERATIFEAIRCALAPSPGGAPTVLVLDDLQWSDETTLELLAALAPTLTEMSVLAIAVYRSDGLPRSHRLRWLRNELRRAGLLEEITLEPLGREDVGALLGELLPGPPSPAFVRAIHDRTLGSPFFVEELVAALGVRDSLREGRRGLELAGGEIPVPDTIREAVLVSLSRLSPPARDAAEAVAVIGQTVDLELAGRLVEAEAIAELFEAGLLEEGEDGQACFRHTLAREALYGEVPLMRRRDLHRQLATEIEQQGGPSAEVAAHWLGAGEQARAREALVDALRESQVVHAHRDAARAGQRALDIWPEGEAEELRLETLERCGSCAELAGELADAAKAWRELSATYSRLGDELGYARAQRRLAGVLDLGGERDAAFAARRTPPRRECLRGVGSA